MRMAGLALIAVVAACSGPAAPEAHHPSPAAVYSPEPVPSLRSAPIIIQTLGFSCRLPVFIDIGPGQPGAFIDFPSGTVTPDPTAVGSINRPGRELVDYFYGRYYDRAYSRWLPRAGTVFRRMGPITHLPTGRLPINKTRRQEPRCT